MSGKVRRTVLRDLTQNKTIMLFFDDGPDSRRHEVTILWCPIKT